jgi:hypothetical protein
VLLRQRCPFPAPPQPLLALTAKRRASRGVAGRIHCLRLHTQQFLTCHSRVAPEEYTACVCTHAHVFHNLWRATQGWNWKNTLPAFKHMHTCFTICDVPLKGGTGRIHCLRLHTHTHTHTHNNLLSVPLMCYSPYVLQLCNYTIVLTLCATLMCHSYVSSSYGSLLYYSCVFLLCDTLM